MIYFIVPAYNEALNVPKLLLSLQQWCEGRGESCQLILVDDGSCDGTAEIAQSFGGFPVTVVSHGINRGVHEAFRSGFESWRELPTKRSDLIVTLEADNTSSLEILDRMIDSARGGTDVVLASCYAPGGEVVGTNLVRTILSFGANSILRCTPGMPAVYTFSSFYRVYRAGFLAHALRAYGRAFIEETGFVCVVEMLLKFGLLNARISEVPLRLDGAVRRGASKMKVLRTIRGYFGLFIHVVTGRLSKPDRSVGMEEAALQHETSAGN